MSAVGLLQFGQGVKAILLVAEEPTLVPQTDGFMGRDGADHEPVKASSGHAPAASRTPEHFDGLAAQ
ncbi:MULTISPECIES: hypothetical protein [Streptomyces]|uniref:hypothetical protein n=1 Tax=Streptomyces TaxID=1883 RepID=UPI0002F0ADA0|nr:MULTISPECIES: hypothetical protein [Streptomyces]MYS95973.1 hypothetical protein [Streptomyces sp. SID5469]